MNELNDEQLIKAYSAGDEAALEALIRRYLQPVYGFVLSYAKDEAIAQDAAQETFIKAWKNFRKFEQGRNFRTWLLTIAKNTVLDQLKKKRPETFASLTADGGEMGFLESIADDSYRPDILALAKESEQNVNDALSGLSAGCREIINMKLENFTFREISAVIGEPLHTVKSRYRRAMIALRKTV